MSKNIEKLLITLKLTGDVSGTLPIYNYNYNFLNKTINKGGNIYLPNKILLNNNLFNIETKTKKNKIPKEVLQKLRGVFTSEEAIKKLYNENNNKLKEETNDLIKKNLNFLIDLFFKKDQDLYLKGTKFVIKSVKYSTDTNLGEVINKKKYLESKHCSLDKKNPIECNFNNLEDKLIETYKENEIKFIKKINPSLSEQGINTEAYKKAIEKYKKGNQDEQIKNFANSIIEKENLKNDLKKANINYIYIKDKGIKLNIDMPIRRDIIVELNLSYPKNIISGKKIHIERGNCKTKKNYIKSIWKKLTKKNKKTNESKENLEKKWIYSDNDLKLAKS